MLLLGSGSEATLSQEPVSDENTSTVDSSVVPLHPPTAYTLLFITAMLNLLEQKI